MIMTEEQKNHYFDWAATSPSDEQILKEAFDETINLWGNPSSLHSLGKEAKKKLEEAREICAKALNLPAEKLYFTSGGTESDHIPILSVSRQVMATSYNIVRIIFFISQVFHGSVHRYRSIFRTN